MELDGVGLGHYCITAMTATHRITAKTPTPKSRVETDNRIKEKALPARCFGGCAWL